MEICYKVYAAAKGEENLKKIYCIMQECVKLVADEGCYSSKPIDIDGWLALETGEYSTCRDHLPEDNWGKMINRVGTELSENGVVIIVHCCPESAILDFFLASSASGGTIFCDATNELKRLEEFRRKIVGSYQLGEELFQWFIKEKNTSVPVAEKKNTLGKETSDETDPNEGCICAFFKLFFDNKQIITFGITQRSGSDEEFQDCFYYRARSGSINAGLSIGALFSKLAEERNNIDAVRGLLKDYIDPEKLELLMDASAIIDGYLDLCSCVSRKQVADPFVMLGMKDIPQTADPDDLIQIARRQGLEKYYDDTLEELYYCRNNGSQSFLFSFYDDEDICVETENRANYKKESLKPDDLGNILKAKYKIIDFARDSEHGFDYTSELAEEIVRWAKAKKANLDVSTEMNLVQLLNTLGLTVRIEDNGYGTDVLKLEGEIVCTELPNSFLELIVILTKHIEYDWDCTIEATFEKVQGTVDIEVHDGHLFFKQHKSDKE